MISLPMRTVTNRDIAEMEALAAKGLCRNAIARATGWSYATVKRYVGHKVAPLPQEKRRAYPDVARYRRMIMAVQGASYGEWDGIAKRFGGLKAVDGVTIAVRDRTLHALIGPNGAGKTTVLNMISGFYRPQAGAIRLGGRDLAGAPAHAIARAGIARTYQTTRLFGSLGVLDNVALARAPGRLWRRSGAEDRAAAAALLDFVGYTGDVDRPAAELPHVDRRLVEIARALAGRPRVLLLDEPFTGVDGRTTADLLALVRAWHGQGRTIVAALHDLGQVRSHFPHTLLLAREGVAWGATEWVLTPQNLARAQSLSEAWDEDAAVCGRHAVPDPSHEHGHDHGHNHDHAPDGRHAHPQAHGHGVARNRGHAA